MPTTRKRKEHPRIEPEFDGCGLIHLQFGDCYMNAAHEACACGILGPGGIVNGVVNVELAKKWWREHKAEVYAKYPNEPTPWGAQFDE